jgi:hypothetical protein
MQTQSLKDERRLFINSKAIFGEWSSTVRKFEFDMLLKSPEHGERFSIQLNSAYWKKVDSFNAF